MTLAHARARLIEKFLYSSSSSNLKLSNKAGEGWGYKNDPEANEESGRQETLY